MYEIKEIKKRELFEDFNLSAKNNLFLQSWEYGELSDTIGDTSFRIGAFAEDELMAIAQVITVRAKRGSYFFIPYGPVFKDGKIDKGILSDMVKHLSALGKKQKIDFIRISPFVENTIKNKKIFSDIGCVDAPMHVLAETTWLLDLTQTEDDILQGMRKTNRNLIRKAEKVGVTIEKTTSKESVEHFIEIHKDTQKKHSFTPYPDNFFRSQVDIFSKTSSVEVFLAKYQEKIISSAIIMYYGNMAAYHHGASLLEFRKIPAAYLVQWAAIKEAKLRGCDIYNFWGVAPDKDKPHPISGVSHFKRGFGGYQYEILHCQDKPLSWKYGINWTIETIRRRKRGYYFVKPQ